jgi:hypothetical protein
MRHGEPAVAKARLGGLKPLVARGSLSLAAATERAGPQESTMSEPLNACLALAAMIRDHGTPNPDEIRFVAHAAIELGLEQEDNERVQQTLKDGGDFEAHLPEITSRTMRIFLFRRLVSAVLLDEQINDSERSYISKAADSFGYDKATVDEYISWMRDGLEWEKRGAEIVSRL